MKVLVVLAVLAWCNLLNVEGNLLEQLEAQEGPRGFFPGPFFPPYQPTYSPGVFPPFNAPPECFPQPVVADLPEPEPAACPVCPAAESCTCEPVLQTCQTYTITVCPSAPSAPPVEADEPTSAIEEIIDEKIVDVQTGQVLSEKQEVVDVTPEFVSNPSMFGPLGGFTPYPGFNQLVGGIYPQYGGFPNQYGSNQDMISALRSLGDDKGDSKSDTPKKK